MWIFTTKGFFSIVEAQPSLDQMQVRARRREHLQAAIDVGWLPEHAEILDQPASDYRYRVLVPRSAIQTFVRCVVEDATYNNFKSACLAAVAAGRLDAAYERALHKVWGDMAAVQETPPYAGGGFQYRAGSFWDDYPTSPDPTPARGRRRRRR